MHDSYEKANRLSHPPLRLNPLRSPHHRDFGRAGGWALILARHSAAFSVYYR